MRRRVRFDDDRKCAVISSHGHYEIYHLKSDGDTRSLGEQIQRGLTDELGLIHNFIADDLVCDLNELPLEDIVRRVSAVCGKTADERRDILEHERATFLVNTFDIEFTGRWKDLAIFEP